MNKPDAPVETTHFGYKDVPREAKADMVADVFHSVAARYDLQRTLGSLEALYANAVGGRGARRRGPTI